MALIKNTQEASAQQKIIFVKPSSSVKTSKETNLTQFNHSVQ